MSIQLQSNHSITANNNEYNLFDYNSQPSNVRDSTQLDKPRLPVIIKDEVKLTFEEINLLPKRIDSSNGDAQPAFLSDAHLPRYTPEQFEHVRKQFNADEISKLGRALDNETELSDPRCDNERTFDSIGSIANIDNLYKQQSNVHAQLTEKIRQCPNLCHKWRKIKGDGNCYYRAIFYNYIELLVLRNDTARLKDVIVDMYSKFQEPKLIALIDKYNVAKQQSDNNTAQTPKLIDYQHIITCMLLVYNTLTTNGSGDGSNNTIKAYVYLIKCYNNIHEFDYGCIFYLRYIVYKFVKRAIFAM